MCKVNEFHKTMLPNKGKIVENTYIVEIKFLKSPFEISNLSSY